MKIDIDASLLASLPENKPLILDFDHTLSKVNMGMDCCGVTRYRLIAVSQVPPIFDGKISSNLGNIYFKEWGRMYLDENMTIRPTGNHLYELTSDSGLLAPYLEILDFSNEKVMV